MPPSPSAACPRRSAVPRFHPMCKHLLQAASTHFVNVVALFSRNTNSPIVTRSSTNVFGDPAPRCFGR